ncbi:MAG TPA: undecaprenyl-phosphate galactose phosphotransferase WbaP [Bryobacteraceae bacterium]|nr:undecaprenyl-phosphate galactose phosphotransferase WbaP [Bryobacteraceae bacterium]
MSAGTAVSRPIPATMFSNRPSYTTAVLVLTDAFALLLSVAISVCAKQLVEGRVNINGYLGLWPFLFVFLMVYASVGLYSGVSLGAPEELRRATISSTVLFVCLAAITVSMRGAREHFTWTLLLSIVLSVALVPLVRECVRQMFASEPWWGFPAVVFGAGDTGEGIVKAMLKEPGLGLKPIAVLDDDAGVRRNIKGVPVLDPSDLVALLLPAPRPVYAIFAMPDIPHERMIQIVERHGTSFSHVLVIPELTDFASLWVKSKSVGGMLGLEIRQQTRAYPVVKRVFDVLVGTVCALVAIPLCVLIAIAIMLDSRGPVFYRQRRIGFRGQEFYTWKFRSMVRNADAVLEKHLDQNPGLRAEWERDQKLRNDPRVTVVGRFLRKSSLDELPQLWNVVRGEMSLVGPRPIVQNEVPRYGQGFETYKRVKGGVTGLWQVSGRSDTSYKERVDLDLFYVRNWSVWLDCCILFRTIAVVLFGRGAY